MIAVLAALLALLLLVPAAGAAERTVVVGEDGDEVIAVPDEPIVQGDTVVFSFQDNGHDLSMGGPGGESFVVNEQDEGFEFRRVLDRPGTYALVCQEHDEDDDMNAQMEVAEAPSGPDPKTLPPPARDVVIGSEGDEGTVDPTAINVFQGAELLFHFAEAGTVTFSDGTSSGPQPANATYAKRMTTLGTLTYDAGEQSGTATVTENTGLGIRPAPAGAAPNVTVTVGPGTTFAPAAVTIDEGGIVEWSWAGGTHNVQFEDGFGAPFRTSGTFAAKFFTPSATPYRYVCTAHPGMEGTVQVTDTGAPGPNEQPPALDPAFLDEEEDGGTVSRPGAPGRGTTAFAPIASSGSGAGVFLGPADAVRPRLRLVRATLRRGRRPGRLRLTVDEDVLLDVRMRAIGRSRDAVRTRRFRLFARRGSRSLALPRMTLTARRYRLRITAIDRSGNRSALQSVVVRTARR